MISLHAAAMPDGCQATGDLNNNGATKCTSGACYSTGVPATTAPSHGSTTPPRRVQVTAKILFGSVTAISTMKHNEKMQRNKSQ